MFRTYEVYKRHCKMFINNNLGLKPKTNEKDLIVNGYIARIFVDLLYAINNFWESMKFHCDLDEDIHLITVYKASIERELKEDNFSKYIIAIMCRYVNYWYNNFAKNIYQNKTISDQDYETFKQNSEKFYDAANHLIECITISSKNKDGKYSIKDNFERFLDSLPDSLTTYSYFGMFYLFENVSSKDWKYNCISLLCDRIGITRLELQEAEDRISDIKTIVAKFKDGKEIDGLAKEYNVDEELIDRKITNHLLLDHDPDIYARITNAIFVDKNFDEEFRKSLMEEYRVTEDYIWHIYCEVTE